MLFALDEVGERVHIDSTQINHKYFCPECGEGLIIKKGMIREHHFSHKGNSLCLDRWHYDMSDWHYHWQNRFLKEQQEIVLECEGKKHRADVLVESKKTVIEFQHSPLSPSEFVERNLFYNNLGYKVVWVFDVAEKFDDEYITLYEKMEYKWKRPGRTFTQFDGVSESVEIYLQIENKPEDNERLKKYLQLIEGIPDDFREEEREYIASHKDDLGLILKVTWALPNSFSVFYVEEEIGIDDFVSKYIPKCYKAEELDTILNIWDKFKPQTAILKNVRSGKYAKIIYDPREHLAQYGIVCGWISSNQNYFSGDFVSIDNYDDPVWIIVK